MPHAAYIDQAAELLVPICEDVGASSLQWDAEEPWMLAHKPMDYREAAERIADRFSNLSCPMGANAIGFVSIAKFGPLADICDYVVPQAYSTTSSGVTPGDGQRQFLTGTRRRSIGASSWVWPPSANLGSPATMSSRP